MDDTRWSVMLGDLGIVTTQLAQAAPAVYPLSAPRMGADDDALDGAESRVGYLLDRQHRELLAHADGWPGAFLDGDVLGTRDIGQGPLWDRGGTALDLFYEYGPVDGLPARAQLYPVFVAPHQHDVMALRLDGPLTDGGHEVLWFANELVDRWPNVREWWLGCTEIARHTLAYVAGRI
ncbi:hypothetical protein [Cellulomonas phragmiteti]|uniref:Knr4/Smi1-like domain-containing protein n=1 Tax=Cellulomonas phragmiteti TaxID=478780 RepID=A0ABQ4DPD0_9CELL|nr:hypothetical protein [Cellulomonas phragmiteti]GIG41206.1 hypothetical protein Cph01nite_29680 [Cellulomonas phragmiteti]